MASFRFYRLRVSGVSSTNAYTDAIRLLNSLGANQATTGNCTLTTDATGNVANIIDEDSGTFWNALGGSAPDYAGWRVTFDFGAGQSRDITTVAIVNSVYTEVIKSGQIETSNDGVAWSSWGWFVNRTSVASATSTHTYNPVPSATAALQCPAPALTAYSGASAALSAPRPQVAFFGGATLALAPPSAECTSFSGAQLALTAPAPALIANGHDSTGEQAANLTAPSPTLSAYAGANTSLQAPSPTLGVTATVTNFGASVMISPSPTLSASGTVSAMAGAALAAPIASLIGYSGAVCSITLTGSPTLLASCTTGATGGAAITCPLFELTAGGTVQNHGSADLIAPSPKLGSTAQAYLIAPGATLTAIGSAVVTATYEAYAINLNHNDPAANNEVTHYTNFPFTKIVRYQGSYFGVSANGLYLLEGTTDDGAPIPWAFKTAMTDFKSPFRKTVVSAYFGGRLGPAATIDLHVGEDGATTYNYATVRSDHAQCYRQKFGRGLSAHYYALGANGAGKLELDNIEFNTLNSPRRI